MPALQNKPRAGAAGSGRHERTNLAPIPPRVRAAIVCLALAIATGVTPALARQPIVTTDLLRLRHVTSIDVAADGSVAVFAVRSIAEQPAQPGAEVADAATRYENRSHLYALDLFTRDAKPRQLTFGSRTDTSPVVSRDGNRVAFLRPGERTDDAGERVTQVWVMSLGGGEPRPLTELEHGAAAPRWAPDGRHLLVESAVSATALGGAPPWPLERPQRRWNDAPFDDEAAVTPAPDGSRDAIRAWLERSAATGDAVVINRLHFQDETVVRRELRFKQLFIVDADAPAPVAQRITGGFYDHGDARFLRGGQRIVYVASKPADRHVDRTNDAGLWTVGIDGSDDRPLLAPTAWKLKSPHPSPDGSVVAFVGEQQDQPTYRQPMIGIVPLDGGAAPDPVWLTDPQSFNLPVDTIAWLPARQMLLFNCPRRGGYPLMAIGEGMLDPEDLVAVDPSAGEDMPAGVHQFAAGGGSIVYTMCSPRHPCVLRVRDGRGDRLVFDLNPWTAERTLSMPRTEWISRPDGMQVQCWIMEPTNRIEGERYPLCLEIHGGPHAMWGPGEFTMWHELQLLCSWGYGVVYANPRGSEGYGYAFQRGNFQNWGSGPAGDVLAALDRARLDDWVDDSRLVVTGGSYGGYLTAWIIGNDNRFQAAVAQRGVYDLGTFFGEGNAWQLLHWHMGGFPWESKIRPILQRESPITYVSRINTPLLIMHASSDLRTGVSQSETLYRSLKQLERPVEYVRYPGAGHDLSRTGDPNQRLDRLSRIIEFFERHIRNARRAPQLRDPSDATTSAPREPAPASVPGS